MALLREYVEGEHTIKEFTKDGVNISHVAKVLANLKEEPPINIQPSLEERLATIELSTAQTQIQVDYLAFMTELATMKGGEK